MSTLGATPRRIAAAIASPLMAVSAAVSPSRAINHIQDVGLGAFDTASASCSTVFWVEGATTAPILSTGESQTEYRRAEALKLHQYYTQPDVAAH